MFFSSKSESKVFKLSAKAIDEISNEIIAFCNKLNIDNKTLSRYRISAEECLEIWLKNLGEGTEIVFETGKKFTRQFFKIRVKGEKLNPYSDAKSHESYGITGNDMLIRIGIIPVFSYIDGSNILTFDIKKKPKNQIVVLVSVILLSFLIAFLGKMIFPTAALYKLSNDVITPISDTFFNVLSAIAGPMIFLSVAWGIYGIGDVYTLGRIGKRIMLEYIKVIFLFVCFGVLFFPFFNLVFSSDSAGTNQFSKIFELILSIFPKNIFSPFVEGNTMQIIFLAFIIGLSLIFLGQRTSSVAKAVEQINHIITFLMEFVSKLVPYFIFIILINLIWTDTLGTVKVVWKFALVFLLATVLAQALILTFVCVKHKQKPLKMFRTILPSYLIAISTASSSATFESNMNICNNKLGINKEFSSFGIPFGMVIFKPTTALYYLLICFYFAATNSVEVSVSWIITAVVITTVSAIATPPIPGGAAATYTILFAQLGIPAETLAIVLAIDMLFDFVLTSGDMHMLLLQMFHISNKIGMRDKNVQLK